MKKKTLLIIFISVLVVLTGCASNKASQSSANNESKKTTSEDTPKVEDKDKNETQTQTQTQTTQETKSSTDSEEEIKYKDYYNNRYLFSIEYPGSFIMQEAPTNNDGRRFLSPDNKVELLAFGSNNVLSETVDSQYKSILDEHKDAANKIKRDNWFIVSWIEGESIVYQKSVVGEGSINTFIIKYPKEQKEKFNEIVKHINSSFKTPGIENSYGMTLED